MGRIISVILFFLMAANTVLGQTKYASSHIEQAVRKLRIEKPDSIPFGCSSFSLGKHEISIRKNEKNVIEHIGIKLFSDIQRTENPLPIYDFIEYAYLCKEYAMTDNKLVYNDIKFTKGSWKDMANVTDSTECRVENIDSKKYAVEWIPKGENTVSIVFPIKYDLILGEPRRQIERSFIDNACMFKPQYSSDVTIIDGSRLNKVKKGNKELYESIGETYIDPVVNNTTYYIEQDSVFIPLFNKDYPDISVKNAILLHSNDILKDYSVTARFVCLESVVEEKSMTLRQLMDFAISEGCKPYVGISGIKDNILKGTVFLYNSSLGYDHIVSFTADVSKVETHEMEFKATVYLFSPTTNVKELFFEEKISK